MQGFSAEPTRLAAEKERITEEIVSASVKHYDAFVTSFQVSKDVTAQLKLASVSVGNATRAMKSLESQSRELLLFGDVWRKEKQMCATTLSHHSKLMELLESSQTLELCFRHEMYHEAALIMEHISSLSAQLDSNKFAKLHILDPCASVLSEQLKLIFTQKLTGPLSLATAMKVTSFLRRMDFESSKIWTYS